MKRLLILTAILLTACGPSQKEKEEIASVTCAIMGETRNMDSAVRVAKMNDARDKIGGKPFLDGDSVIKESFEYGLCKKLVLNESYDETVQSLKDAKRESERRVAKARAERARIEREKLEELERIARKRKVKDKELYEKLITEGKQVSLYPDGNIEMARTVKNDVLHGELKRFHSNGKLMFKVMYENGQKEGLQENYDDDGNLAAEKCFKNGSQVSLEKCK
ncbi:hypothetical protein N8936_02540 [Porticoccaceae bacterium]|nr:hypothetical protein [Porticoccaceae bacterium]